MPDYKEHLSGTEKFTSAVFDYATNKSNKILKEVQEKKQRALKAYKEAVQKESRTYIKTCLQKENAKVSRELAHREQDLKKNILKKRSEMTEEIFAQAKEKLKSFTGTDEYANMLEKQAENAASLFACEDAEILIRKEDEKFKPVIEKKFNKNCVFSIEPAIKIGGMQIKSQSLGIMADLSLDAMLENEREWFRVNSSLSVI